MCFGVSEGRCFGKKKRQEPPNGGFGQATGVCGRIHGKMPQTRKYLSAPPFQGISLGISVGSDFEAGDVFDVRCIREPGMAAVARSGCAGPTRWATCARWNSCRPPDRSCWRRSSGRLAITARRRHRTCGLICCLIVMASPAHLQPHEALRMTGTRHCVAHGHQRVGSLVRLGCHGGGGRPGAGE